MGSISSKADCIIELYKNKLLYVDDDNDDGTLIKKIFF